MIAVIEGVALSPLLVIGLRKGIVQRRIRIAGRPEPVTGRQAVAVGLFFLLGWCVMVSAPFWIEAVVRR